MSQENIRAMIKEAYGTLLLTMQETTNPIEVKLYNATCVNSAKKLSNPIWINQYVKSLQDDCLTKIILEKLVSASLDPNFKGFSSIEIGNLLHGRLGTYTRKYFQTAVSLTSYSELKMQELLTKLGLVTPFSGKDMLMLNVRDFLKKVCQNGSQSGLFDNSFGNTSVATIKPDLVIIDNHQAIVLDLTSQFGKAHFQKTKTYAVILNQVSKMVNRNIPVVYGEIYWNDIHAATLLRKLDSLSMNRQFVREFPVDPGVMDSMSKEQLQTFGKKNPYALSALEHETVLAFDVQGADLKTIFHQLAHIKSINAKDVRAVIEQL